MHFEDVYPRVATPRDVLVQLAEIDPKHFEFVSDSHRTDRLHVFTLWDSDRPVWHIRRFEKGQISRDVAALLLEGLFDAIAARGWSWSRAHATNQITVIASETAERGQNWGVALQGESHLAIALASAYAQVCASIQTMEQLKNVEG